jgi:hypothetical protein
LEFYVILVLTSVNLHNMYGSGHEISFRFISNSIHG